MLMTAVQMRALPSAGSFLRGILDFETQTLPSNRMLATILLLDSLASRCVKHTHR